MQLPQKLELKYIFAVTELTTIKRLIFFNGTRKMPLIYEPGIIKLIIVIDKAQILKIYYYMDSYKGLYGLMSVMISEQSTRM